MELVKANSLKGSTYFTQKEWVDFVTWKKKELKKFFKRVHRYQAPFRAIEFFESAYPPFSVAFSLASGLNRGNKNDKY